MATEETIKKLKEEGFKEVSRESLRTINYQEIVEYYSYETNKWMVFAKR